MKSDFTHSTRNVLRVQCCFHRRIELQSLVWLTFQSHFHPLPQGPVLLSLCTCRRGVPTDFQASLELQSSAVKHMEGLARAQPRSGPAHHGQLGCIYTKLQSLMGRDGQLEEKCHGSLSPLLTSPSVQPIMGSHHHRGAPLIFPESTHQPGGVFVLQSRHSRHQ